MGFSRGFGLGEQVGWKEGYQLGLQRGAQLATELGFYQGFVHAWITILEHEDPSKPRKLAALKGLLEMTKNFPKQTVADDDMFDKLHKIRAKFKQVVALLELGADQVVGQQSTGGDRGGATTPGHGPPPSGFHQTEPIYSTSMKQQHHGVGLLEAAAGLATTATDDTTSSRYINKKLSLSTPEDLCREDVMASSPGGATAVGSGLSSAQPTPRRRHKRHRSQSHIAPTDPLPPLPPLPSGDAIYQTIQPQSGAATQRGEPARTLPVTGQTGQVQQQLRTRSKETLIDGVGDYATTTRATPQPQSILPLHSQSLQAPSRGRHTRSQSPREHRSHQRQTSHPGYSTASAGQQGHYPTHGPGTSGSGAKGSDHRTALGHHHAGRSTHTSGHPAYASHGGLHSHYDSGRYAAGQLSGGNHSGYPSTIITYDELCESVENERQRRRQRGKGRTRCCCSNCGKCCRQLTKLTLLFALLVVVLVVACKFWCPDSCKSYLSFGSGGNNSQPKSDPSMGR
ncbi:hypothetical protein BIW11_08591 [Tropilaelaps mercedesae]|uniref:Essential protein Yae1 N-terminal domain-containing protein n=1 Tax=Tropilaelaps mercedesae TaxID=418985 RepID=A0A1V9XPB8_9ACAR|nr:hypothetical protein BIW11_08591 [Tropilaelaps mercedesae]